MVPVVIVWALTISFLASTPPSEDPVRALCKIADRSLDNCYQVALSAWYLFTFQPHLAFALPPHSFNGTERLVYETLPLAWAHLYAQACDSLCDATPESDGTLLCTAMCLRTCYVCDEWAPNSTLLLCLKPRPLYVK